MANSPLSALVGGILLVWWPEDEYPNRPGPKYRPGYVLDLDLAAKKVLIAYGTTQRLDVRGPGEVIVTHDEMCTLKQDTKFCFKRAKWLPLLPEFLSKSQSGADVIYVGAVPKARADDLLNAMEEAQLLAS
ncbi:hypothetical protein ACT3UJ_06360 [Halomonas sp. 86]|uniref:hypothetical protein n=1 Tax=unclassified Halomonas TaxID=2609666 RepID=UPI0040343D8E